MEDPLFNKTSWQAISQNGFRNLSQQKDGGTTDKNKGSYLLHRACMFLESVCIDLGIGMGLTTCCTGFGGCVKPSILNKVLCKRVEQDPLFNKQAGKLPHRMDFGTCLNKKMVASTTKTKGAINSQSMFLESVCIGFGIGRGLTTCYTGFGGCVKPS